MACKIRCPKCKFMLKEEDDGMKKSQGEYRVYDSHNSKHRLLLCLSCNHSSSMDEVHKEECIESIPAIFDVIQSKIENIIETGPCHEDGLVKLVKYVSEVKEYCKKELEK